MGHFFYSAECYQQTQGFVSYLDATLRTYIDSDNFAQYFRENDWRGYLIGLNEEIVNEIMQLNLKGVILNENTLVILKDRMKGYEQENVLIALKADGSRECQEVFNN
jgi:hypothetical protein